MDPKGNSLGRINTHSRHAIGNGSEVEGKRWGRERESKHRGVCVCPLGPRRLPRVTTSEKQRIGREREREGERVSSWLAVNIGQRRVNNSNVGGQSKRNSSRGRIFHESPKSREFALRFDDTRIVASNVNSVPIPREVQLLDLWTKEEEEEEEEVKEEGSILVHEHACSLREGHTCAFRGRTKETRRFGRDCNKLHLKAVPSVRRHTFVFLFPLAPPFPSPPLSLSLLTSHLLSYSFAAVQTL